jgi:hypothetical protein
MKKFYLPFFALAITSLAQSQTVVTGPSTTNSPYLLPLTSGYTVTSLLSTGDMAGTYKMCGTPDGTGAFDNGDGTMTLLVNHEFGNTVGVNRAHGQPGAFVSKWVINKANLNVVSGADLIQNVNIWTGTTYTTYNASNTSTLINFGRFCSADLAPISALYNPFTGRGTQNRIFMNGEETGTEGRIFAHVVTGTDAGSSYELPWLGKFSCENALACPNRSDKTIVIGTDDATPGQLYCYVGNKQYTGTDIEKAGLKGGTLYGISVLGFYNEANTNTPAANTSFTLVNMGNVATMSGATLNANSNNAGITNFLRPEDGTWDPANPRDFYFVTTNAFGSPSRLWRLRFNDINAPENGGTITMVLNGTQGNQMFDNITMDNSGHIYIQEDPGNNAYVARVWMYDINTNVATPILEHDQSRFVTGATNFLTQDEESSGILDVQAILGPGKFIFVDQAHYSISGELVEGGQILLLNSAISAASNPEIAIKGNNVTIAAGNTVVSASDLTQFGNVNLYSALTRTFIIENTGAGVLKVSGIQMSGANAGDFTVLNPFTFPLNVVANGTAQVVVKFAPATSGNRSATINVLCNDLDEALYSYALQGTGTVQEIKISGNSNEIIAGSTVTSSLTATDFGNVQWNDTKTYTYEIANTGNGVLTIQSLQSNNTAFTVLQPNSLPLQIQGGSTVALVIAFNPGAPGSKQATITLNNDDSDEAKYAFAVSGNGTIDTGIEEAFVNTLKAYPVPADETLYLEVGNTSQAFVTVTDLTGKKIYQNAFRAEQGKISIPTGYFANGAYLIHLTTEQGTESGKIIISH